MKNKFVVFCAVGLWATSVPAYANPKLAQSKACLNCHTADKAIYGPAYKDVATRYRGVQQAERILATKIRMGSKWNWGTKVMPPQPVTEAEARELAKWIMQTK